ncbi:sorting nexin-24 isoform X1 [Gracilinanus agilis]|uniref:sorting nexin-24 isoform X1 n=1 Tax=Gracilinanus agilis TaxID=191870 RepID=UPI001CFCBFFF|nr:sorting nexin-24 isoform X1 [Gracilinanus agilis]XP_044517989.1 sorting nexin-24 isoform X1 [Gracilinanus agilis]
MLETGSQKSWSSDDKVWKPIYSSFEETESEEFSKLSHQPVLLFLRDPYVLPTANDDFPNVVIEGVLHGIFYPHLQPRFTPCLNLFLPDMRRTSWVVTSFLMSSGHNIKTHPPEVGPSDLLDGPRPHKSLQFVLLTRPSSIWRHQLKLSAIGSSFNVFSIPWLNETPLTVI